MKMHDANKAQIDAIIQLGFSWCGADGFVCHMSQYKNEQGQVPCDFCPRKKDWENNGVFQLDQQFQLNLIKERR